MDLSEEDRVEYVRELDMTGYSLCAFNAAQAYFIPTKNMNDPRLARGDGMSWEDLTHRRQLRIKLGLEECALENEALTKMHEQQQDDPKYWRRKDPLPKGLVAA